MSLTQALSPRRTLLSGVAALALVAGAAAGSAHADDGFVVNDPALNVPAQQIEHTIVDDTVVGGGLPRHTLDEMWLGSDKAHTITRDAATGRIVGESTFADGKSYFWNNQTSGIQEMDYGKGAPPIQTLAQEAAIWRHTFQQGKLSQTGTTTVNGRPSLLLQSVPGKWKSDDPTNVTTMTVDADTFTLYEIKTVSSHERFSQDQKLTTAEELPRTAQNEHLFDLLPQGTAAKAVAARKAHAKHQAAKKHTVKKHKKSRK